MILVTSFCGTIHQIVEGLKSCWRNLYYRMLGVKIESYVWMRAIEIPRNWQDITLEGETALDRGVTLLCSGAVTGNKLIIRSGTYINRYTILTAHQHLEIGHNCLIGPQCYITDANHGMALGQLMQHQKMKVAPTVLEDEVWIAAGVTILPGVRIGKGAIVGAGSVVTKDVPSNAVVIGIPAKILKFRN